MFEAFVTDIWANCSKTDGGCLYFGQVWSILIMLIANGNPDQNCDACLWKRPENWSYIDWFSVKETFFWSILIANCNCDQNCDDFL